MKITLQTEGTFDAAHHLLYYDGPCSNVHGHTWRVVVKVQGDSKHLNNSGILLDFKHIKDIWKSLDHSNLNDFFGDTSPSAENIALYIYNKLTIDYYGKFNYQVKVYESPTSFAMVGDIDE